MIRTALLALLAWPALALAQLAPGPDSYTWPAGAKSGQTVEVRLGGSDWTPDVQFVVADPRVKLELVGPPGEVLIPEPPFWFGIKSFSNDPRLPRERIVRLTLPADLPPGPVRWCAVTATGAGGSGVFWVGDGPEITELEDRAGPQQLPALPVTVNGRLRRIEEVDRYTFQATTTGLVTCEILAQRLGSDLNAVVEIFDGAAKVTEAVDTESTDPVVTFATEKGRNYTIVLRDVEYRGYRNFTYRLKLTTGPRVVATFPTIDKRAVEVIGYGVATGKPKLERILRPDASVDSGTIGKIERRGQRDVHTFTGKKGETWDAAIQARGIGSSVTPSLSVVAADGKQLASKDWYAGRSDPRLSVVLPADGDYQVLVSDVSGRAPALDSFYRVAIARPTPGFTLRTVGIVNVPIGGKATLKVDVEREGGFKGPIALALTGLPEGVSVPKEAIIAANAVTLAVPLDCTATAGTAFSMVQVNGTATVGTGPVTVRAVVIQGDDEVPAVLMATTMKVPFKVKSPEADGTRKAARGATHLADLLIERTDGFAGDIILDMAGNQSRHRQGIRGPVFTVGPKQERILYPVTVPEWLESTRTSRIALVAMARIPDPKGTPRWVLTAMDGQVTMSIEGSLMKLTHDAEELTTVGGDVVAVPLKLLRVPQLTGAVRVELVVPPELQGLVSAAPLEWPADRASAVLKLASRADPKLIGVWKLTARATTMRESHPVVSETEFEVEFTRPPQTRSR